jgi:hypothetical protein
VNAQAHLVLGNEAGLDPPDGARGGAGVTTRDQYLVEIAECLDEADRLQSRVIDLTERVYQAAGMSPTDRALRGKVTGLLFGLVAHLGELNRLVQEET